MTSFNRPSRHILVAMLSCCAASPLHAAEPSLRNLDIRGLKIAGTTTLTIDGDDLGKTPRLLLPFAAKQTLKPGGTDKRDRKSTRLNSSHYSPSRMPSSA